jgi:hypothetical protein
LRIFIYLKFLFYIDEFPITPMGVLAHRQNHVKTSTIL